MKLDLAVTGVGMLNPVGLTGLVAFHNVRSSVSRLAIQPFPDRAREWVVGGVVPTWIAGVRERRLAALAIEGVRAALLRAGVEPGDRQFGSTTALLLGAPERLRPGYRFPPAGPAFHDLIRGSVLESFATVDVTPAGACSAQASLERALDLFRTTPIRRCVIGAADTQLQLRTIRWHEENFRLKCSYATDGLMPAEAACFVVVEPEEWARARRAAILARLVSVATASEFASVLSDRPNTAAGLTAAVRATLDHAGVRPADVGTAWCDLNGESYRAREWAFTEVRLGFTSETELMHPADCHGDLGAATDASLLGLAAIGHGTGWSDGRPSLVFSGSEGGIRAATLVASGGNGARLVQVSKGQPRVFSTGFRVPAARSDDDFRKASDPPAAYFEWLLHEEHRDQLAALHYQRAAMLQDATIPWPRLREPEQRMLNHLDAIVAAGPVSMAAIAAGVRSDEEGACFAGALLIGTLPNVANFARLEEALREPDPARVAGISAGLLHAPESDEGDRVLARLLDHADPAVQAMAVSAAAKRRVDIRARLPRLCRGEDADVAKAVAGACRRFRMRDAAPFLDTLLSHGRGDVRREAVLALLMIEPAKMAAYCRSRISENREFGGALALGLGVGGQLADAQVLLNHCRRFEDDVDAVAALGILGAPSVVPPLIDLLSSPREDVRLAAAAALDVVSGPHARERVGAIEPADDTSLRFWTRWWDEQRSRLNQDIRWRRGGYFNLAACIDELVDPTADPASRQRAYMELAVRVPEDVPFEPDWFVSRQDSAIATIRARWHTSART